MTNKSASVKQEKRVAKRLKGKQTFLSGGGKFEKGDVLTEKFFIEAKTRATAQSSITVKKEWIKKAEEQAFAMGKENFAIAINFDPNGETYYVINERLMQQLNEFLNQEESR